MQCEMTINGYTLGTDPPSTSQTIMLPPCPRLRNCTLTLVDFEENFDELYGLQISAVVAGKAVDYYMDDLQLEWSNNTCAAQSVRSSAE